MHSTEKFLEEAILNFVWKLIFKSTYSENIFRGTHIRTDLLKNSYNHKKHFYEISQTGSRTVLE